METRNKTKVSVIIPCYNCAASVSETLESLAQQTYRDFKVICINDGSRDDTLEVLRQWEEKGTLHIEIIDQENGGVSRARNRGLEQADTEYVMFLDADDIYHKDYIFHIVAAAEQHHADVAYCRLSRELETVRGYCDEVRYQAHTQQQAMDKLLFEMYQYGFYCYLYHKSILDKYNVRFDVDTKYFEDREFNWKYLCHCTAGVWVDAPLYGYRVCETSAMQKTTSWQRTVSSLSAVKRVEAYLEQHRCEYLETLRSYLFQRVMWSVSKNIALCGDKALYKQLRQSYDVKSCMKRTTKDQNRLVSLASRLYLIHPMLFFYAVRLKK